MRTIDINADLGEGFGNDAELLKYVSSVNIACGMHAGSPAIMSETVKIAIANSVSLGAHPGYDDRDGFGRKEIKMEFAPLVSLLNYQIGALNTIIKFHGGRLSHVKAHGALYNMAAKDQKIAKAIIVSASNIDRELIIFGPAGSEIEAAAVKEGMLFACEVFADRGYNDDGSLVSRTENGAHIENKIVCLDRVLQMINDKTVDTISGLRIPIKADTICLHGDNEQAIDFAKFLTSGLISDQIKIAPFNA